MENIYNKSKIEKRERGEEERGEGEKGGRGRGDESLEKKANPVRRDLIMDIPPEVANLLFYPLLKALPDSHQLSPITCLLAVEEGHGISKIWGNSAGDISKKQVLMKERKELTSV